MRSASIAALEVYIHTRNRLDLLRKVVPAWLLRNPARVSLVVEPGEYFSTIRFINSNPGWRGTVRAVLLPRPDRGMGAARAYAVRHAHSRGIKTMIMSDDDLFPRKDSDPGLMVRHVEETGTLGCGVCVSFYGMSLGNDFIKESSEVVYVSGSWGYRCFALNVPLAIRLGNFDPALDVGWEDHEMCRYGIRAGHQWSIHTGAFANSIGARYAPGGIAALLPDPAVRRAREEACHAHIYKKWGPEFISQPGKAYRCQWRKLLQHYGLLE